MNCQLEFRNQQVENGKSKERILGQVLFCSEEKNISRDDIKFPIHFSSGSIGNFVELWLSDTEITEKKSDEICFRYNDEILFGQTKIEIENDIDISEKVKRVYLNIFHNTHLLGFLDIFRMWNYIPNINQNIGNLEVYKAFCFGRSQAFEEFFKDLTLVMPAATGVGKDGSKSIDIYFLAAKHNLSKRIENPNQIPAYKYPDRYGPKSPSFSRAVAYPTSGGGQHIFISGTASIVGHNTVSINSLEGQLNTIKENLICLLSLENLAKYGIKRSGNFSDIDNLKVYFRNLSDLNQIKEFCFREFGNDSKIIFLRADICRSDLLIEIEGTLRLF